MCDESFPLSCWTSVGFGRFCKLRGSKEFWQLVFSFWLQSIILFLVIAAVLDLSVFSLKFDDHVRADRFVVGFIESEFRLENLKWKIPYLKKIFILREGNSVNYLWHVKTYLYQLTSSHLKPLDRQMFHFDVLPLNISRNPATHYHLTKKYV